MCCTCGEPVQSKLPFEYTAVVDLGTLKIIAIGSFKVTYQVRLVSTVNPLLSHPVHSVHVKCCSAAAVHAEAGRNEWPPPTPPPLASNYSAPIYEMGPMMQPRPSPTLFHLFQRRGSVCVVTRLGGSAHLPTGLRISPNNNYYPYLS